MSMKKLAILFYLLSCSIGSVAQDLWFLPRPNEKCNTISSRLIQNDSDLVHSLLDVESTLMGSLWVEKDRSRFENDQVALLLWPESKNPLDMMQKESYFIVDHRFFWWKVRFVVWRRGMRMNPRPATDKGRFIQSHNMGF